MEVTLWLELDDRLPLTLERDEEEETEYDPSVKLGENLDILGNDEEESR